MEKPNKGRPQRELDARIRALYVFLRSHGACPAKAAELTGIPRQTWDHILEREPALKEQCEGLGTENDASGNFEQDIQNTTKEIFYRLKREMVHADGIALVQIAALLKRIADEHDMPTEEYVIVDAKHEVPGKSEADAP